MDSSNRFYIPKTEDIYIGYEAYMAIPHANGFGRVTVSSENIGDLFKRTPNNQLYVGRLFVEYLTKEQIEDAGWIFGHEFGDTLNFETFDIWNNKVWGGFLSYNTKTKILKIQLKTGKATVDGPELVTKFEGLCPSINEFRKIFKLIK